MTLCLTPPELAPLTAPVGAAGRLVAIVATHNRKAALARAMAALLAHDRAHLAALIVVDCASSDGTWEMLSAQAAKDPDRRLWPIRLNHNAGGAGGFAAGMTAAMRLLDPDWLLLLDDDAWPEAGALAAFHASGLEGVDMVAASVRAPDGAIMELNRPSRNPFWHWREFWQTCLRGRDGFHIPHAAYDAHEPTPIEVTSFVGLFLRADLVARMGVPDARLFVSGEDGLYTLAASRNGFRGAFLPQIRFRHDCRSFDAQGAFCPIWKAYFYHRNLLLLYRAAAGWAFWLVLLVIVPKWLSKARRHKGARARFVALIGLALWDGLRRNLDRDPQAVIAAYRDRITS